MATTSPDNLRSPDLGSVDNPVSDFKNLADDVQAAINKRGNFYIGTAAQRAAFTTAAVGVNWQDTDGTMARYRRVSGAWLMMGDSAYHGTAAQRTAFTTAPAGTSWQDTDGNRTRWVRVGSAWHYAPGELIHDFRYSGAGISSLNTGVTTTSPSLISGQKFRIEWSGLRGFIAPNSWGVITSSLRYRKDGTTVAYNTGTEAFKTGAACGGNSVSSSLAGVSTLDSMSSATTISVGTFFTDTTTAPAALNDGFRMRIYGA